MQTNRRQDRMPATNTGFASGGVTCKFGALWIEALKKHSIRISMDGRRRAIDNIYIERFWRTIKQDYVYMNPCEN
ncbi:MAG: hypothetical protein Q7U47_06340, partial [Paludibacter sp.]|nr:hypothetical protein [Paludibacter sp.]